MTIQNRLFCEVPQANKSLAASEEVLRQQKPTLAISRRFERFLWSFWFFFFQVTFFVESFALLQSMEPANRGHLSTKTAFVCTKGWSLCTGFTVLETWESIVPCAAHASSPGQALGVYGASDGPAQRHKPWPAFEISEVWSPGTLTPFEFTLASTKQSASSDRFTRLLFSPSSMQGLAMQLPGSKKAAQLSSTTLSYQLRSNLSRAPARVYKWGPARHDRDAIIVCGAPRPLAWWPRGNKRFLRKGGGGVREAMDKEGDLQEFIKEDIG